MHDFKVMYLKMDIFTTYSRNVCIIFLGVYFLRKLKTAIKSAGCFLI